MKTISNKKLGNDFESEFCQMLSEEGFWVHNMAQNAAGQPADVIAVKGKKALLIDCKVCTRKGFVLSRIEENQDLSMELWRECGNGEGWFAIKTNEEVIFMLSHLSTKALRINKTIASIDDLAEYGCEYRKWVKKICK